MINPKDLDNMISISALLYSFHQIIVLTSAIPRLDIRRHDLAVMVNQLGERP